MPSIQEFRTGRHVVIALTAHLVFLSREVAGITPPVFEAMRPIWDNVCNGFGAQVVETGYEAAEGYVHLLVTYPPTVALATLVNSLKGVSARLLRKRGLTRDPLFWSPSYCAVACGEDSLEVLRAYLTRMNEKKETAA